MPTSLAEIPFVSSITLNPLHFTSVLPSAHFSRSLPPPFYSKLINGPLVCPWLIGQKKTGALWRQGLLLSCKSWNSLNILKKEDGDRQRNAREHEARERRHIFEPGKMRRKVTRPLKSQNSVPPHRDGRTWKAAWYYLRRLALGKYSQALAKSPCHEWDTKVERL